VWPVAVQVFEWRGRDGASAPAGRRTTVKTETTSGVAGRDGRGAVGAQGSATVRFWAGARHAAGHAEEPTEARNVGELRAQLAGRDRLAKIVSVAAFLVDGVQAMDTTSIPTGCVVDVLPPFAGG
jgi:molybdopterin synthase sulfur carrier subunit